MPLLSERSQAFVKDVARTLLEAEMLSEANAGRTIEPSHKRKRGSQSPPPVASVIEECQEDIEVCLSKMRDKIAHRKFRSPDRIPEYKDWARYVAAVYEGKPDTVVAFMENCHIKLVHKARRQHGRTLRRGFPAQARVAA